MFLSIIIVTYNDVTNLEKSLLALQNQTFKDYELIIIDGLSSDNTFSIIQNYKNKNADINLILKSEKDNGIYDAMNKGIDLASGKWIYFYNAGDVFIGASVLNNVYQQIEKNNADIFYGKHIRNLDKIITPPKKISYYTLNKYLGVCHQTIFCKTDKMIKFDTNYKLIADFVWLIGQYKLNREFKFINEIIVEYDINGKSSNLNAIRIEFFKVLKKFSLLNYSLRKILWKYKKK